MNGTATLLFHQGMNDSDLEHIRAYGQRVDPAMEAYADDFHLWLSRQPKYAELSGGGDAMLGRIAAFQDVYWHEFFSGMVDEAHVAAH